MSQQLDFESHINALEARIRELRLSASEGEIDVADEIEKLSIKVETQLKQVYQKLTPWQKVEVSRHESRPHAQDYIDHLIQEYQPLAGDRAFAEDAAIVGGMGYFFGKPCMVIGHEKGRDTRGRIKHNFGMPRPEGFRKARRLIDLAGKFHLPVISFVDTAGAYPGLDAEARGQAEAIARSIQACIRVPSPFVAVITGEGGSGGAIAIAAADRLLMLEHAVYSVISPEGCASILWRDSSHRETAAKSLQITAQSLNELGITDEVISEPTGGAHRDHPATFRRVSNALKRHLNDLGAIPAEQLIEQRWQRYLKLNTA
ncbi:MAG: acetyl-CoA carboxylase carboxyltransferase subunit alpha [Alphaproteobacteria bacterium]|nr:acetyl-CoA carboxylase carboxyltransferase subunit alpha [Alphaproteobacteria bacterium]